jgi:homoserine dehydrogenase
VQNVYGILNGTTNYILTQMLEQDVSFDTALKRAQELGYAEADPSLDIDGWDSAHKIALLAFVSFGKLFPFEEVYVEGIRNIDLLDVELGKDLGYTLKLLAIAKRMDSELELRVHPTFIPSDNPLAKVSDVYNAILVEGRFCGKNHVLREGCGLKTYRLCGGVGHSGYCQKYRLLQESKLVLGEQGRVENKQKLLQQVLSEV